MIKFTNEQVVKFLAASEKLSEVSLDNVRGDLAANLHAEATLKHLAYQYRAKSLEKERVKLLKDHAQHDAKGEIKYGDHDDPAKRPVLWKNQKAADAAFNVWVAKMEALNTQIVELDLKPLPDDFFAKPAEIEVKHAVRIGFLPVMAKYQAALAAKHPAKKAKR